MDPEKKNQTKLFMSLVLSSQKDLYVYILSLVFSPSEADDILQDALTVMWQKFDEFEPGSNFLAWGKQIARYKVLNYLRKNQSSRLQFDSEVLEMIASKADQKRDEVADRRMAMKQCLQKLSEKHRRMLKMRYIQEMSYKQMAVNYGISKQSVCRAISRVHAMLVKCVQFALADRRR